MAWMFCTSGAAIGKAGVNLNADIWKDETAIADYSNEVEGAISMKTRKDWSGAYATTGILIKQALADATSDLIAIKIINYDMSGYIKGEAQTMLDVLTTNSDTIIKDLREEQNQELNK